MLTAVKTAPPGDERCSVKVLALRRAAVCAQCSTALAVGTRAVWDASTRTVLCLPCHGSEVPEQRAVPEPPAARVSVAGGSAQAEYQRRSERRERAVRSRHPKLGGLLLALTNEPASTRVWAQGAAGERAVAGKLDELAGEHVVALHDRKMLRPDGRPSRANIDHLVVAATGVWVVDAKTHKGSLEVRRSGGLFSPRVERLFIAGRDKTSLLVGLANQVRTVRDVLCEVAPDIPVRGALCFVGTELPWFGESIDGVPLVGRRGLGKLLRKPGELAAEDREALAAYLETRFVPA